MDQRHIPVGLKITLVTILLVSTLAAGIQALVYWYNPNLFEALPLPASIALTACASALLTGLILLFLTRRLVDRPLRSMINTIREAKQSDYLLRIQHDSPDSLGELARSFNSLMERITALDAFKIETEQELLSAQQERAYKDALVVKNKHLTLLYDMARILSDAVNSEDIYQEILGFVGCMMDYDELVLMLYDSKSRELKITATYGIAEPQELIGMTFSVGEGVTGAAIAKRAPIYVPNTQHDTRYLYYKGQKPEDVSLMAVPLLGPAEDTVIGALNVSRSPDEPFENEEQETLQAVSHLISLAIRNARLYRKMRELSVRDELTGLYNRRYGQETLTRELMRARRFQRDLGVLMIDIDHFKKFNDRYGHPMGDLMLKEFANLLEASVRDVDLVTRWGGEEFLLILPNTDLSGANTAAEKIRRNVKQHRFESLQAPQASLFTVSIGVAAFPEIESGIEALIEGADKALYAAKTAGRNRVMSAKGQEAKRANS